MGRGGALAALVAEERERKTERDREREKSGTKRTLARPHESLSLLSNLLESLVWERERDTEG